MQIELILMLALGLLLGAALVWLLGRQKQQAAFEQGKMQSATETAVFSERVRSLEAERESLLQEQAALRSQHGQQQAWLDTVRQQHAQLEVAAARVPGLEQQLSEKDRELRQLNERLIELSSVEAAKDRALLEAGERLQQLAAQWTDSQQKIALLNDEIRQLGGSHATLEEQAAQIPGLKEELAVLKNRLGEAQAEFASLMEKNGQQTSANESLLQQLRAAREELAAERAALAQSRQENSQQKSEIAELNTRIVEEQKRTEEKLALLNGAREQLTAQFQHLANQILDEKAKKFTEQNQTNIGNLLLPLQEKIREFQSKVEETYDKESKQRFSLEKEIQRLAELNTRISEDAVNLTQALKGNNKTQGTWGEIVLENVLESSGLRKGLEYETQASYEKEGGGQHRPDVVIRLPEGKHMVVDSKMSLLAYERYTTAETETQRQEALKQHLASVRGHIKGLSEKNYQNLHGLKSLDFVLLFIPVEPAFMLAVTGDQTLFSDAFAKNVLLVSPSTLLATLRTIANIWRQEYQNRNAQEIASQCARLYDKFVGFVEDLEDVGRKLQQTQKAYDSAHGKLAIGRGNLIRQAEAVKKLGVKPNKSLPAQLVDLSLDEVTGPAGLATDALPETA